MNVAVGAVPSVTNNVSVSNVADANPSNNAATHPTAVHPATDLSITGAGSPNPVTLNGTITYTLSVLNTALPATGVTLNDTLPAEVSVQTVATTKGTCNAVSPVVCTIGTLASGAAAR